MILFISSQLLFKKYTSVNTTFLDQDVSLVEKSYLKQKAYQIFIDSIPKYLFVDLIDKTVKFKVTDLVSDFIIPLEEKNNSDTLDNLNPFQKKEIKTTVKFNFNTILGELPYKIININSPEIVKIRNNTLQNCGNKIFLASINTAKLDENILDSLLNNTVFKFDINDYLLDSNEYKLIKDCEIYWKYYEKLKVDFESTFNDSKFDKFFEIVYKFDKPSWELTNENELKNILIKYAKNLERDVVQGEYQIQNQEIFLFRNYQIGKKVNIDLTIQNIKNWISQKNSSFKIEVTEIEPEILSHNLKIIDFTYKIAEGRTRLHRILNNAGNEIFFAEQGMYEIDNVIVKPKELFSYIDKIQPKNGWTRNGRLIGGGICNATTTLFRAVLESGFPVVERFNHGRNYFSYSWGYPLNIVDAAYLSEPRVDLKFINDLNYPVMFKIEIAKDPEYQYHTIKVLTSSSAPKRRVELKNWKTFNVYSQRSFSGSFDREVFEGDTLIRSDNFFSKYY